jgi:exopolysaccharide biosynthesis polyprenyl glycosylphosphotransferase
VIIFYLSNFYQYSELQNKFIIFKRTAGAVVLSGIVSITAFYLFGQLFELTPKINLLILCAVFLLVNWAWRILVLNIFTAGATKIMILGDAPLLNDIESYIQKNPHAGYQIAEKIGSLKENDVASLAKMIKDKKINTVIIQPNIAKDFSTLRTVFQLLPTEVNLVNAWDFYEILFEKVPLKDLEENWFIEKISTHRPFYDAFKRLTDVVLSIILGIIFLPFGLVFAFLIKVTSRGPAIFKQERMGKNNRTFNLFKFRTMNTWRGGKDGTPAWTEEKDPRITAFGRALRFTHFDEIPQLWNIAKGDISFTGPRPERVELAETFSKFPYYEIRHIIKPGLSGWAQINYKPSASLEEAYEKLCYDIYYVKNRSIFLDFIIIFKTVKYVFVSHF